MRVNEESAPFDALSFHKVALGYSPIAINPHGFSEASLCGVLNITLKLCSLSDCTPVTGCPCRYCHFSILFANIFLAKCLQIYFVKVSFISFCSLLIHTKTLTKIYNAKVFSVQLLPFLLFPLLQQIFCGENIINDITAFDFCTPFANG